MCRNINNSNSKQGFMFIVEDPKFQFLRFEKKKKKKNPIHEKNIRNIFDKFRCFSIHSNISKNVGLHA